MNKTANRRHAEAEASQMDAATDNKALVFMGVGIPGSGKSTFLRHFADQSGIAYLSSDALREEMTGSESDHSRDRDVWERYGDIVQETLAESRSIVLDSTNIERDRRIRDIARYREMGARGIIAVVFDVPLQVALDRNEVRGRTGGRQVPYHAMNRMYHRWQQEPITIEEGFDDIIRPITQRGTE